MIIFKTRREIVKTYWKIWNGVVKDHILVVNFNEGLIGELSSVYGDIMYIYISFFKFVVYRMCFQNILCIYMALCTYIWFICTYVYLYRYVCTTYICKMISQKSNGYYIFFKYMFFCHIYAMYIICSLEFNAIINNMLVLVQKLCIKTTIENSSTLLHCCCSGFPMQI